MRDHHHRNVIFAGVFDGIRQGAIPGGIEVGVGLVQNQKAGIAKECARQSDTLFLPPRQRRAIGLNHRFITMRQHRDHVVNIRQNRGAVNVFVFGV